MCVCVGGGGEGLILKDLTIYLLEWSAGGEGEGLILKYLTIYLLEWSADSVVCC